MFYFYERNFTNFRFLIIQNRRSSLEIVQLFLFVDQISVRNRERDVLYEAE